MRYIEAFRKYLLLVVIFFFSLGTVKAQDFPSIKDLMEDTAMVSKLPVPVASISSAIDQTSEILTEIDQRIQISKDLEKIDSLVNVYKSLVNDLEDKYSQENIQSVSSVVLKQYQFTVDQNIEHVQEPVSDVRDRIKNLESADKTLSKLLTIWETTEKAEASKDLSQAIRTRLREVKNKISQTKKKNDNEINKILETELTLSEFIKNLNNILDLLKDTEKVVGKNILLPDQSPIWKLIANDIDSIDQKTIFSNFFSTKKTEIRKYYVQNQTKIYISFAAILITLILFLLISHQIVKDRAEVIDEFEKSSGLNIFEKPVSVGLIIGLYIGTLILGNYPIIIRHLIYFIAIIPISVLFIKILPKQYSKYIVFLASLFFLNIISEEVYSFPILSRIIYMVISAGTFFWLWMILRYNWFGLVSNKSIKWLINAISRLFLIFLAISFLGSITGHIDLVNYLLYGMLNAIFVGFFSYILYLTVSGIFFIILQIKKIRELRIYNAYRNRILKKLQNFLKWFFIFFYAYFFFRSFDLSDPVIELLMSIITFTLKIGSFELTILDLLNFVLVIFIALQISQFTQFILNEQVLFKSKNQKDISASISSLVRFTIMTIGFIIAVLAAGFELDKLALLISAFGVGIGFGLQNIFNNLVSGVILVFERPLQVGDTIEVGTLIGEVKSIGIRSSTVRTYDGAEVIVPNGNLISNDLINWTHSDLRRRLITKVGVAYGTDPQKVIDLLKEVAVSDPNILETPHPYVLFIGFGDSSLDFELRCWTDNYDDWIFILSDLKVKVNDAIKNAGIEIPFPQRDLHVRTVNPQVIKSVKPTRK